MNLNPFALFQPKPQAVARVPKPRSARVKVVQGPYLDSLSNTVRYPKGMIRPRVQDTHTQQMSFGDGWGNLLTGLGRGGRDKRMANTADYGLALSEVVAEDLYAADSMARRIIELLPSEALREWITFEDEQTGTPIQEEMDRLQVRPRLLEAWVNARLYGGGGIFINDGTPLEQLVRPLNYDRVDKIRSLTALTRWELICQATDIHRNIENPSFGLPRYYRMFPRMSLGRVATQVHSSRIIRFDGKKLPRLLFIRNNFWGDSVLTSLYERLGDYKMTGASIASVLTDFRLLVLKMKGLTQAVAAGKEVQIQTKMQIMNEAKSVCGSLMIDAEDDFGFQSSSLAGVADLVDRVGKLLQAETDIPHTILFNESPSGLGATGRSEERQWFDHVHAQQMNYLKPRLDQLMKIVFAQRQGPTKGQTPTNWKYNFDPLWQEDEDTKTKRELAQAQADQIYVELGVKSPEDIQRERFPEIMASLEKPPALELDKQVQKLEPGD